MPDTNWPHVGAKGWLIVNNGDIHEVECRSIVRKFCWWASAGVRDHTTRIGNPWKVTTETYGCYVKEGITISSRYRPSEKTVYQTAEGCRAAMERMEAASKC